MDDAGAEDDRGNVPFSGGTQAHYKPNGTLRNPRLVNVRYDRRIEQCGRLDRIFHGEVGADEQSSRLGNAAEILPKMVVDGIKPDLVTDQTSAHDELDGYIPNKMTYSEALALRKSNPDKYVKESFRSMAEHVIGILKLKEMVQYLYIFQF